MIQIKLDKFEGPLGLLLQLIEKQEMDITEVSLAKITDQYIDYIKFAENMKPDEMADFLVVAAKLLLIKSKALLPYLQPEEEKEIAELEMQLKMYKEFLAAAKKIDAIIGRKKFMFAREFSRQFMLENLYKASALTVKTDRNPSEPETAPINFFSPPKKITAKDLFSIFNELIKKIKPLELLEEKTLAYAIKIEDKIMAIQRMLLNRLKVSFNKVITGAKNKTEIIITFLALLELIKQRHIAVVQDDLFGEIEINKI